MRKHPHSHREAKATAPVLDSTRLLPHGPGVGANSQFTFYPRISAISGKTEKVVCWYPDTILFLRISRQEFLAATPETQHLAGRRRGCFSASSVEATPALRGPNPISGKLPAIKEFAAEVVFEVNL
jgi:hypothetical protein